MQACVGESFRDAPEAHAKGRGSVRPIVVTVVLIEVRDFRVFIIKIVVEYWIERPPSICNHPGRIAMLGVGDDRFFSKTTYHRIRLRMTRPSSS